MHGVLAWVEDNETSQLDRSISFLKFYLGKSTLNVLCFNVDLMSTFSKVKSENNLSDGLLTLAIHLIERVKVGLSS
jgi:hypothetical protein